MITFTGRVVYNLAGARKCCLLPARDEKSDLFKRVILDVLPARRFPWARRRKALYMECRKIAE
jgi:hypothetical protein